MTEWFEEWFGEEYLALYPHRDDEEAEAVLGLIDRTVGIEPDHRVLDLACGAGRHARAFQAFGARPVGLDLSRHLLDRAALVAPGVPLIRADIRAIPVRPRSMDLTVNLFTSFGYFGSDADHLRALSQMLDTVKLTGWFVLDFLNATMVRASVGDVGLRETRDALAIDKWLQDSDRYVVKSITTEDGRQFLERVRLYGREELIRMVAAAGGRVVRQFGDYDGGGPADEAPRVILFAQVAR